MNLVVDADLLPAVPVELPAAVEAALHGWYEPLKRLFLLDAGASAFGDIDVGLFVTTTCDDGNFPWSPLSPISTHQGAYEAAVAALPPGATGLFGKWAAQFGTAAMCTSWPTPSGGQPLGPGPLPDVPVLVLSGDRDTRTPTSGARIVASRFKHAFLTVVPGVGHSVLGADLGGCAESSVVGWLAGRHAARALPGEPASAADRRSVPPLARDHAGCRQGRREARPDARRGRQHARGRRRHVPLRAVRRAVGRRPRPAREAGPRRRAARLERPTPARSPARSSSRTTPRSPASSSPARCRSSRAAFRSSSRARSR